MSQEKTSEEYKDPEWFKYQYITLGKTIKSISQEFGYSKSTLTRYKCRFNLKKYNVANKSKISKKNLVNDYITNNMMPIKIAEKYNVNRGYIFELLSKWNIERSSEAESKSVKDNICSVSKEKYNGQHFNATLDIIEKRKQTTLERYGAESFFRSDEYKNRDEKRNTIFHGKTIYEWATEYSITNIILYRWYYKNKNASKEQIVDFLENYIPNASNVENTFKDALDIEIYNKFFNLKEYPDLRYKPDFKISENAAINVDGLYWHSSATKDDSMYHFKMRKEYEDLNLRIFQFREDEINDKIEIVKSMILNHKKLSKRIYARKTQIGNVNQETADKFLNRNHLMGTIKAKHVGLYYNSKLVMIFSYKIYDKILKIERNAASINHAVVGGFSKLLKYLMTNNEFEKIHYWVDLRYGTGTFLKQFGFNISKETLGWKWTDFSSTFNRLRCRANMDQRKLSQEEHASELGWHKIYDAGQRLWIYTK
jgi:hypothetical protein